MTDKPRVRIYPTSVAYIPGVAAVERLVSPDAADWLTAFRPPAFTQTKPDGWETTEAIEGTADIEAHPEFPKKLRTPVAAKEK